MQVVCTEEAAANDGDGSDHVYVSYLVPHCRYRAAVMVRMSSLTKESVRVLEGGDETFKYLSDGQTAIDGSATISTCRPRVTPNGNPRSPQPRPARSQDPVAATHIGPEQGETRDGSRERLRHWLLLLAVSRFLHLQEILCARVRSCFKPTRYSEWLHCNVGPL